MELESRKWPLGFKGHSLGKLTLGYHKTTKWDIYTNLSFSLLLVDSYPAWLLDAYGVP